MDYSFFALGLIGALLGYIVGDFQRERRYRRESRANLALANDRYANAHADADGGTFALTGTVHDDYDGNAAVRRETGRRAIPRPDPRARVGRYVAGRDSRFSDAAPVGAGHAFSRLDSSYDC